MPAPVAVANRIFKFLESLGGSDDRARLATLWEHWAEVMGEELAELGQPVGHKDDTLLLGARDSMEIQELSMQSGEILEKANGFLRTAYFSKVRVNLLGARTPLHLKKSGRPEPVEAVREHKAAPAASGKFLDGMDMGSPVARCYARFAGSRNSPE